MLTTTSVRRTQYNFKDTIKRHSHGKVVAIIEKEGYYDMENGGKYVEGVAEEIELSLAAILPLSSNELRFDTSGTYNQDSRKLYAYKAIPKSSRIVNIKEDESRCEYTILANQDYSEHDPGLYVYYLKRVGNDDKDN